MTSDYTECSTGRLTETIHRPTNDTDFSVGLKRESRHPTKHMTDCSTGRESDTTPLPLTPTPPRKDQTVSTTGLLRQSPHPSNDQTYFSSGHLRQTPHPLNEPTDSITLAVTEPDKNRTQDIKAGGVFERLPSRRKTRQIPTSGEKLPTRLTTGQTAARGV